MAKRQADTELNHDNWDQEDKKEEAGTFRPISDSMLQNRIIKRAKRTLNSGADGSPSSSPFSAFSGFSKQSSQPAFSFQMTERKVEKTIGDNNAQSKEVEAKNGCNRTEIKCLSDVQKDNLPSQRQSSSEEAKPDNKKFEYFRQLQKLNESVLKWMQFHIGKNPCCDFTPVFNDYRSHLQRLEMLYPVQKKVEAKSSFADAPKSTPFKMQPVPTTSKGTDSQSPATTTCTSGLFSFGKNSSEVTTGKSSSQDSLEMKYGANFASNTTNTSTVSFGIKTSTATTPGSTVGISSVSSSKKEEGSVDEEEKKGTSGFSFGFKSNSNQTVGNTEMPKSENKPFQFSFSNVSGSAKTESANDEEGEYVPPKNEFTPVSEEDALYSKRCKLFFMKDDAYVEKGIGTVYLKDLDGKTQLLIRADTSLGNILLNIILSASLPMKRSGKNNVLIVCVPNPPIDAKDPDSKKAIPLLIRVKTSEDADELFKKLNELKS